jgi:hypothetical protein
MGIAELGLHLFFEAPPQNALILLRRALHANRAVRAKILGPISVVPSLFTYDTARVFVEFDADGRLLLTTLGDHVRIPLIRYAPGDHGFFVSLPAVPEPTLVASGVQWEALTNIPIVAIHGRGHHALSGTEPISPEAIKEGLYHDPSLPPNTTANFRLASGAEYARVRIQLSPGVTATEDLAIRFQNAIAHYVAAPFEVACESYESFSDGMALDYERKFNYLGGS